MPARFAATNMRRNRFNFLFTLAVLLIVTACVWRSQRSSITPSAPENADSAPNAPPVSKAMPDTTATRNADVGDFIVEHLAVTTPRFIEIDSQVKTEKLLEKAADQLNRALILPHDIILRTKDCNDPNAFYDPADRSVTMCYELMERMYSVFKSSGLPADKSYARMFEAVRFVFLHEIGHSLIDAFNLPIGGNEEDAADRLAAYVNLTELGDEGIRSIYAAADVFSIESKRDNGKNNNLADEHLLQEQRFYNSLCMIYGSDTVKHRNIVSEGYLPKERAGRCETEYKRTAESWASLLQPWRKN